MQPAGVMHADFERDCFIRAQTIGWEELLEAGTIPEARNKRWLRRGARRYTVEEASVRGILFNL